MHLHRLFPLLALPLSFFSSNAHADNPPVVLRYGLFEQVVHYPHSYTQLPGDLSLRISFTNPGGETLHHYGYQENDRSWRIRFRPDFPGYWKYQATFSDGTPAAEGTFRCLWRYAPFDPVYINRLNPSCFRRGVDPLMIRGLSVSSNFLSPDFKPSLRSDFLNWFQNQGYNTIFVMEAGSEDSDGMHGDRYPAPFSWAPGGDEYAHLETILNELNQRGILLSPFGSSGAEQILPPPNELERFSRYFFARFGHFTNLLLRFPQASGPAGRSEDQVANGTAALLHAVRKYDVYGHAIGLPTSPGPSEASGADWLAVQAEHYHQGNNSRWTDLLSTAQQAHDQPVILSMETPRNPSKFRSLENLQQSDRNFRRAVSTALMSGAGLALTDANPNLSSSFSSTLRLTDRTQHQHDILKQIWDFVETTPWFEMQSRNDLSSVGHCLANPGQCYLVYVDSENSVDVAIDDATYGVEWIDPGQPHLRISDGTTGDEKNLHPPDSQRDWFLLLRRHYFGMPDQIHLSYESDPAH